MRAYFSEVVNSALEFFDYTSALWLAEQHLGSVQSLPDTDQIFARHQLAGVLVRMQQYRRVFDVLGESRDIYSLYLKGLCCLNQDDLCGAEQHLSSVFKLYPDANEMDNVNLLSHITRLLGNVYMRSGRETLAKQAFETALHKNDSLYSVWEAYVQVCNGVFKTGSNEEEKHTVNISPFSQEVDNNSVVQEQAAMALSRDEDVDMDELVAVRKEQSSVCQLYQLVQQHKHSLIPTLLAGMQKTTRRWPVVRCYVAASHYHLAFHSSAAHVFAQVVRDTPWCRTFLYLYSTSLWHQQKNEALSHLAHNLQQQDRYSLEALLAASNSASLQGSHILALNFLERACTQYPHCAYAHTLRGQELQAVGRETQGLAALRIAVGKDPSQYTAQCSIAIQCAEEQSYHEAFLYIHSAIRVNPNNPVLLTYFARIRAFTDMHKNALATLQRAAKTIVDHNPHSVTSLVMQQTDAAYDENSIDAVNTVHTIKTLPTQILDDDIGLGSVCTDMLRLQYNQEDYSPSISLRKELLQTTNKVKQVFGNDTDANIVIANVFQRLDMHNECENTRATVLALQGQAVNTKRKRKDALEEELAGWDIV